LIIDPVNATIIFFQKLNPRIGRLTMSGIFGSVSKSDCVMDLFYGTDYHCHLGTKRGGMAVHNPEGFTRFIHNLENSYFRSKFEDDLSNLKGNQGIGVISDLEDQPIIANSHLGRFALVTVGKINNLQELEKRLLDKHMHFSEHSGNMVNPTELVAMLICEEESFKDGIQNAQQLIKGSCSMLILTEKGIYAARDKLGRTPVVIGKKSGAYAATSETIAFPNLGFDIEKYLGPGEIVLMTPEHIEQIKAPGEQMQVCSFLWVYYGYPASYYDGINVDECRYRCGAALAKNDDIDVDYVSGIPDSGVGHAIGYAMERHIPYVRPYVKYTPTWPRSFMPQNQDVRNLVAKMKLIPNKALIEGKRIVFCEDSIVRGTQLYDNIQILNKIGAREIHVRVACPTLLYPCDFLNFSISRSALDLAGRKAIKELEGSDEKFLDEYAKSGSEKNRAMVETIKNKLETASLKYQKMEDLINAIGLPKEKLCTHCWDNSSYF
jgi:amidophosphoribosyltransferase